MPSDIVSGVIAWDKWKLGPMRAMGELWNKRVVCGSKNGNMWGNFNTTYFACIWGIGGEYDIKEKDRGNGNEVLENSSRCEVVW